MRHLVLGSALAAAALIAIAGAHRADAQSGGPATADGTITVPRANYQREWAMLGVWAHLGQDAVSRFNVVYTQPESVTAYQSTGAFPPGTILLKELRGAHTGDDGSGDVSSLGPLTGWFVMVKPEPDAPPDGPLWGDGWGWAKFDVGAPNKTISTDYRTDCLGCHKPVESTDWVHIDGYPLLRK